MRVIAAIFPLSGEKTAGLLCAHHKIIVEPGEYGFDSFPEEFVNLCGLSLVFPVQPMRNFKR